ncbi:MAG: hypothetical protein CMJ50_05580 [Planctomycetaceae bacterium]|nr:hypothetical protein [Planctomycetaceae bacterium]
MTVSTPTRPVRLLTGGVMLGGASSDRWTAMARHYPTVADPNPDPTTCFHDSEIRLPQGYTKGRRPETSALLRSIASCGNKLARCGKSLTGDLVVVRDSRCANPLGHRGLI